MNSKFQTFHDGGRYHIESFYMITASVKKELNLQFGINFYTH